MPCAASNEGSPTPSTANSAPTPAEPPSLRPPGLTAFSFVPNPFGDSPGARLYRTGDLVQELPSGDLRFLSRKDRQTTINGVRKELGEIESAMAALDGVAQA